MQENQIAIHIRKAWAHPDDWTWDIEATDLLNENTIDYTSSPYRLKDNYFLHCVVFQNHADGRIVAFYDGDTYQFDGREYTESKQGEVYELKGYAPITDHEHYQLSELKGWIENTKFRRLIAHNQISYDLLALKLLLGLDYAVGEEIKAGGLSTFTSDSWGPHKLAFWDTLVVSKCLNPDRYGGHSLEKLSSGNTSEKFGFRKGMHPSEKFKVFAADMLYYCIFDVKSNTEVYDKLIETYNLNSRTELFKWASALKLEHGIAELITRQEHRGFHFNRDKAEVALDKLDSMMAERKARVEPLLPPRPATKKFMGEFTPPKIQIKKNGDLSSHMANFLEKHGGVLLEDGTVKIFDVVHALPMPQEPLKTHMAATIDDTTHIKKWLVGELGWNPAEYKEKDLTVDTKKVKLKGEALEASINRYVDQTFDPEFNYAFRRDRLEHLEALGVTVSSSADFVKRAMLRRAERGGVKVLTNPSFTVGADKDMDEDLNRIAEKFPFAKDIIEYLTYRHRRNSILGGGIDWDDPDEEPEKGYLAGVREDGRIATPADTCGAATSRFKHRKVANVPRVTSLFGKELRELFGVAAGFFQIGYDFDSLEARIESAYCWQYDADDKAYCKSLMMEKPFDVHTKMAQAISKIIGTDFGRSPAKNVKYGCTYGAQAAKVAKTIGSSLAVGQQVYEAFWMAAFPLDMLKKQLTKEWEANGKKYIIGIDGRRVPTRSAHAILNSLFQSGGVICAKRAMLIHDRKLKAAGLAVDFFKDDWKNMTFCQQMIAYHDEAQLETNEKVEFKMFPMRLAAHLEGGKKEKEAYLKDLAQTFKNEQLEAEGKVWSDISHYDKGEGGVFVAYSRAGVMAVEAVSESGQFYSTELVPVDLTAGYIIGQTWASCH